MLKQFNLIVILTYWLFTLVAMLVCCFVKSCFFFVIIVILSVYLFCFVLFCFVALAFERLWWIHVWSFSLHELRLDFLEGLFLAVLLYFCLPKRRISIVAYLFYYYYYYYNYYCVLNAMFCVWLVFCWECVLLFCDELLLLLVLFWFGTCIIND